LGTQALVDEYVLINGVNMSSMCKKGGLKITAAELDDTAFGDLWHSRLAGLKDFTLDVEFNQDFAAAQTDALLWPLFGTVTTIEIRPTSAARSATNPAYTGSVLIKEYTPIDGSVGDLASASLSWPGASPLLRQVA
jgi:hypothetical protein